MNIKGISVLILVLLTTNGFVGCSSDEALAEQYRQQEEKIKKLILSVEGADEAVEALENEYQALADIDKKSGITLLEKRIAALRKEVCVMQQENPELRQHRTSIDSIIAKINSATASEQKELKGLLVAQKKYAAGGPEFLALDKKIKALKKTAYAKTKDLRFKKKEIQKEMQEMLTSQISQTRALVKQLHAKYKEYHDRREFISRRLKKALQQLKTRIASRDDIKRARRELYILNRRIAQEKPCLLIDRARTGSWITLMS